MPANSRWDLIRALKGKNQFRKKKTAPCDITHVPSVRPDGIQFSAHKLVLQQVRRSKELNYT